MLLWMIDAEMYPPLTLPPLLSGSLFTKCNKRIEDEAFVSDPPIPPTPRGICTMCFF